jgi:four helix bundle protein
LNNPNKLFRFEELDVWQRGADVGFHICNVADKLEERRRYRFAEQLRSAALSISNNIAEGSGSTSNNEFRHFLNIARRSAFECASKLAMFKRQGFVTPSEAGELLSELHEICKMITGLSRSLA